MAVTIVYIIKQQERFKINNESQTQFIILFFTLIVKKKKQTKKQHKDTFMSNQAKLYILIF